MGEGFRPRVAPLALTMAASSSQQAMAASSSIAGKRRKVEDETTLETTLESVIARAQQQRSAAAQARQSHKSSVKKRAAQARRECHEVVLRNLPYRATALDVRDIFPTSDFSVLTVRLITDSSKAIQSKGYGYVEFASPEQARQACALAHASELVLFGRTLRCSIAEARRPGRAPSGPPLVSYAARELSIGALRLATPGDDSDAPTWLAAWDTTSYVALVVHGMPRA